MRITSDGRSYDGEYVDSSTESTSRYILAWDWDWGYILGKLEMPFGASESVFTSAEVYNNYNASARWIVGLGIAYLTVPLASMTLCHESARRAVSTFSCLFSSRNSVDISSIASQTALLRTSEAFYALVERMGKQESI